MMKQGMAKVAREKGAACRSVVGEQPSQTNGFREFVSLPAQWHEERRRQRHNNQSGQMIRGSGKMAGGGAGRQEEAA
jgi:hypothetical protein